MRSNASGDQTIAFDRYGSGEPLLLIHGTGLDRHVWTPIIHDLAQDHDVLVVDLPGHGDSRATAEDVPATPIGYARVLASWLDGLGLQTVHVAGNSVGGWTALELAKLGRARSVVALAPAGLWPRHDPLSARAKLWTNHQLSRRLDRAVPVVLRSRRARRLFFAGVVGDPDSLPMEAAIRMARSTGSAADFSRHLRQTMRERFRDGHSIEVPVTVAWGEKEHLIPPRARREDELPPQTRMIELPGCGHVPLWDAPERITSLIRETEAQSHAAPSAHPQEAG